ncbi:hypothetical protein LMG19282_01493 [Cupriavidus campinensis]|nr:ankyrin repeat domain-containing protein [Cupriavidus campinensis]CAG2138418.1 hypothetical protein LMG19282_01493 [Cupriavidus campinensis]
MDAKQEFFDALYAGEVQLAANVWRENNLDPNSTNSVTGVGGNPALGFVLHWQDHAFARELISRGADVNARGENGETPIWGAADSEGVELLVAAGAEVNARVTRGGELYSRGATPLHKAVRLSNADLVAALIKAGANVRAVDADGVTPLHYASTPQIVNILVQGGADLDARDKFETTPREHLARTMPGFEPDPVVPASVKHAADAEQHQDTASAAMQVSISEPSVVQTGKGEYLFVAGAGGGRFAFISKEHADQNVEFPDADSLSAYLLDHEEDPDVRAIVYSTLTNARGQTAMQTALNGGEHGAGGQAEGMEMENSISRVVREVSVEKEADAKNRSVVAAPPEQENAIQLAPGARVPTPAGTGENTIQSAGGVAAASTLASGTPAEQKPQPPKTGPATLLNGRFVRRDNGEYFRIADGEESKRVALVDEVEKIRFVDKQMDAFQAAIELAKHKEWEAILVTGTEKFRSEAWYHAKLAGLEVVGYEPTEKDLETLRTAQARGDNTASASQQSADAASARLVAASRDVATEFALKHGAGVQAPNVENGRYVGKIVHETDHHVVQDVGKRVNVVHDKARLDARQLAKARERREHVGVQYSNGRAALDLNEGKSKSQGLSR